MTTTTTTNKFASLLTTVQRLRRNVTVLLSLAKTFNEENLREMFNYLLGVNVFIGKCANGLFDEEQAEALAEKTLNLFNVRINPEIFNPETADVKILKEVEELIKNSYKQGLKEVESHLSSHFIIRSAYRELMALTANDVDHFSNEANQVYTRIESDLNDASLLRGSHAYSDTYRKVMEDYCDLVLNETIAKAQKSGDVSIMKDLSKVLNKLLINGASELSDNEIYTIVAETMCDVTEIRARLK